MQNTAEIQSVDRLVSVFPYSTFIKLKDILPCVCGEKGGQHFWKKSAHLLSSIISRAAVLRLLLLLNGLRRFKPRGREAVEAIDFARFGGILRILRSQNISWWMVHE